MTKFQGAANDPLGFPEIPPPPLVIARFSPGSWKLLSLFIFIAKWKKHVFVMTPGLSGGERLENSQRELCPSAARVHHILEDPGEVFKLELSFGPHDSFIACTG